MLRPIRAALMAVGVSATLSGAQPSRPPASDSSIRIILLTMGQGDHIWELFGHNAIWVHDPSLPTDYVYNWGVFDFRTQGFLYRFLRGDMRYTMDAMTIENTIGYYQYLNRRMWAQELNLTPTEKRAVVDYIRWNFQPENRQYRYNYYLDNCSTRVRDIIDRVVGGQLRAHLKSVPTQTTYRDHSLRMMQSAPLLETGIQVALGRPTDTLLNADQASFLPVQLMGFIKDVKLDGGTRPLVLREWMMNEPADRAPEPSTVPALWKWFLPIGLGLAAVLLGLWFQLRARKTTATIIAILSAVIGLVGLVILLLVTVTDHVFAHRNENMWMLNPVWLVVAVALPMAVIRPRSNVAKWATVIGAALSICAVLMHVVGLSRQPNWSIIALLLPVQLAMAAIAWKRTPG